MFIICMSTVLKDFLSTEHNTSSGAHHKHLPIQYDDKQKVSTDQSHQSQPSTHGQQSFRKMMSNTF